MKRFTGFAVVVAVVVAALSVQSAGAHATLVASDPPEESVVPATPDEVRLTFDMEINAELSSVELMNATGSTIAEGNADPDDPDRASMIINLPDDVPPGELSVSWTVVEAGAAEEHEVEGQLTFTIDPTATPSASPTVVISAPEGTMEPIDDATDGAEDDDAGGIGRGALSVGGVSILVALSVVATVGRRRWWR